AKYALSYLYVQAEFGVCCPLSMTDALTRTIRKFADPALVARYLPGLTSQDMDVLMQGAMFMTEQQAGSDVGLIATVAKKQGEHWALHGDKWFCSNADAGLALVLARPESAPEGQAWHPRHAERRDQAGRRLRLAGRRSAAGLQADGRHDQHVAALERHARGRPDAPRAV